MRRKFNSEEERKQAKKEWDKKYYQNNKEKILLKVDEYQKNNKEKINIYHKEHYQNNKEEKLSYQKEYAKNNEKQIKIYQKDYYKNNKKEIRNNQKQYSNNRYKNDINYKLACDLRSRLRGALKGNFKSGSAVKDLGCSIPELKFYLEALFKPGMAWNNWSYKGWHIDHIIPLTSFNLQNREEFLKACHYTNLQPLWSKENYTKSNKITSTYDIIVV